MRKQAEDQNLIAAEEEKVPNREIETFTKEELDELTEISAAEGEDLPGMEEEGEAGESRESEIGLMEGVWFESSIGVEEQGKSIQDAAQSRGWTGIVDKETESEGFWDSVEEAENYLNEMTPEGKSFGVNEMGDWGLWDIEGEEEMGTKAPSLAEQQKLRMEGAEPEEELSEEERAAMEEEAKKWFDDEEEEKAEEAVVAEPQGRGGKQRERKRDFEYEGEGRMPAIRKKWAEPEELPDTPVGFFEVKIVPSKGSVWEERWKGVPKQIAFLMSAPVEKVTEAAQKKISDLSGEWAYLDPGVKVELVEAPTMIQNVDVVGEGDEVGDFSDILDSGDLDIAREYPDELSEVAGPEIKEMRKVSVGQGKVGEGGGSRHPRNIYTESLVLQVKNGQLFWAADETIVQKQLAPGRRWVKVGDTYVDMSDEEAQHISAAIALKNTSILSEFRDELYPLKAKVIEEGDRVYVRPLCKFAEVINTDGERYEVAVSEKMAGIYWAHEIEPR